MQNSKGEDGYHLMTTTLHSPACNEDEVPRIVDGIKKIFPGTIRHVLRPTKQENRDIESFETNAASNNVLYLQYKNIRNDLPIRVRDAIETWQHGSVRVLVKRHQIPLRCGKIGGYLALFGGTYINSRLGLSEHRTLNIPCGLTLSDREERLQNQMGEFQRQAANLQADGVAAGLKEPVPFRLNLDKELLESQ